MNDSLPDRKPSTIDYPECDGKPIADNALQFEWIVTIKEGLAHAFSARPDLFVAGDLLWYPVEGRPDICTAPDAMVAIGRPRGHRRCYKQWEEGGVRPQVVFEVRSPNNRMAEMVRKLEFYEEFGVEEYYLYYPDQNILEGWRRFGDKLQEILQMEGWVSPALGIRFELAGSKLTIFAVNGRPFLSYRDLAAQVDRMTRERGQIATECDQLARERDRIAAELRALGVESQL